MWEVDIYYERNLYYQIVAWIWGVKILRAKHV